MEKIKLSFSEPDFRINHKKQRIRCILNFETKADYRIMALFRTFELATNDPIDCRVEVVVSPSNGDKFDVETGMKVARARAEKLAYRRMARFFNRFCSFMAMTAERVEEFQDKAYSTIEHNDKFIANF